MEKKNLTIHLKIFLVLLASVFQSGLVYALEMYNPFGLISFSLLAYVMLKETKIFNVVCLMSLYAIISMMLYDYGIYATTQSYLEKSNYLSFVIFEFLSICMFLDIAAAFIIISLNEKFNIIKSNKALVYALVMTMCVYLINLTLPVHITYTLFPFLDYLYSLPLIGLSGYDFIIWYVIFSLILKDKNYILYCLFGSIVFLGIINKEKSINKEITMQVVQFPFYEVTTKIVDPDALLTERFNYLLGKNKEIDVNIMAEGSVPFVYTNFKSFNENNYIKLLRNQSYPTIAAVSKKEKNLIYNASIFIEKSSLPKFSYKNILFPIGEKPLFFASWFSDEQDYTAKDKFMTYTVKGVNISPILCFENHSSKYMASVVKETKPDIMIVQSNESWVETTPIRTLFNKITQVKAKEFGLPILKVDGQGPSILINNEGKIIKSLKKKEEVAVIKLPINHTKSYASLGLIPTLIIFIISLIINAGPALFKNLINRLNR